MMAWEPVDDGEVSSSMYVDNGGKLLGVFAGDDYTDWYATEDLPDDIRLCRQVPATPSPVGASVPVEIAETMRACLETVKTYLVSMQPATHEQIDAALTWLAQQRGQG